MTRTDNPTGALHQQPPTLLGGAMDMWRRRRLSLSGTAPAEGGQQNPTARTNRSGGETPNSKNSQQQRQVEVLRLTLRGIDLVEMPVASLGDINHRVAVNRCVSIGKFQPGVVSISPFVDVFTSKVVAHNQNPVWEEMTLAVNDLCGGGDLDSPILISVHEFESKEKGKQLMGSCQTTVRELVKSGKRSTTNNIDMTLEHNGRTLGRVAVVWAELGTFGGNNVATAAVPENNWLSRTLNLAAGLINSNSQDGEDQKGGTPNDRKDSEVDNDSNSEYSDSEDGDESDGSDWKRVTRASKVYPVARITPPRLFNDDDDDDDSQSTYSSDSDSQSICSSDSDDDEITVADVLLMAEESMRGTTSRAHREGLKELTELLSPKRALRSASNILQEMPEWDLDGDSVVNGHPSTQPQQQQQQQQQGTSNDDDVSVADLYLDESKHAPTVADRPRKHATPGLSTFMNTSNERSNDEAMNDDLAGDDDTVLLRQQVALSIEANKQGNSKRSARRRAKRKVQKTLKSIYGILKENLKDKSIPLTSIPENSSPMEEEKSSTLCPEEEEAFDWVDRPRRVFSEEAEKMEETKEMDVASPTGDGADSEAVHRLVQLGFDHATAKKAFLAAGKNEMVAANLLMDGFDLDRNNATAGSSTHRQEDDEKLNSARVATKEKKQMHDMKNPVKGNNARQNSPQPTRRHRQRRPSMSRSGSRKDMRSMSPSRQQSPLRPSTNANNKPRRVFRQSKSFEIGHKNLGKLGLGLATKLIGENSKPNKHSEQEERRVRGRRSSFSGGSSRRTETTSAMYSSSDMLWLDDTPVDYLVFHGLSERDAQTVVDAAGIRTMGDFAFFDNEMLQGLVEATGLQPAVANKLSIAVHVFHTFQAEKKEFCSNPNNHKKKGTKKQLANAAVKVAGGLGRGAKAAGKGATKLGATAARSTVKVTKTVAKSTVHAGKAAAARGRVAHHHHQMKPSCLAEQEDLNLEVETLPSLNIR